MRNPVFLTGWRTGPGLVRIKFDVSGHASGETENKTSVERLFEYLPDAFEEIQSRLISRAGNEMDIDPVKMAFASVRTEIREHLMFNASAQGPATQQKGIDVQ
jgi:hypothetical protein